MALPTSLRTIVLAGALVLAYGLAVAPVFAEQSYKFNIAAQNLGQALEEFGAQSGLQIAVSGEYTQNKQSGSASGTLTAQTALQKLLAGTGLEYRFLNANTVVVEPEASATKPTGKPVEQRVPSALEEVIVTAEKRAESLQNIPIAISAFSGSALEKTGIEEMRDLRFHVPGLEVGVANGVKTNITLRGVGGDIPNVGGEAGVTVSQNGVPLARDVLFNVDFLDIERVEVLRGPQGTINGRNSTGGAINIYTKLPTDEFEAGVKSTFGNYDRVTTEGYLSGPLFGRGIKGRLALSVDRAEGWFENRFLNEKYPEKDKYSGRMSFLADITDSVTALFIVDAIRDKGLGAPGTVSLGRIRPDVPSNAEREGVPEGSLEDLWGEWDYPSRSDKTQYGATLKLTWDISASTALTSISGYNFFDMQNEFECDATRLAICVVAPFDFNLEQVTQELTLTTDLNDHLDLVVGALYLGERAKERSHFFSTQYLGIGPGFIDTTVTQDLTSYAVYGQLRYQITDTLRVSVGARYTDDAKDYRDEGIFFGPFFQSGSDSWSALTPRVAIDYTPSDDLTLFASVARGFKAGGFNSFQTPVKSFNPEFVWSYEAGVKSQLLDGRVRLGGSIFYTDYTDLQQNVFGFGGNFSPVVLNAGQAEIKGLELEIEAQPTDSLRIGLTGTYLDAKFTKLRTADSIYPELGEPDPSTGNNVRDLAGNRLPRAPEWQFSVFGEYSIPIFADMTSVFRVDYSWRSDFFFSIYNHELDAQDAYGLLNIATAVETEDGSWKFSAFARNLLDKRYLVATENNAALAPVPYFSGSIGVPRTYGLSVAYRY